MLLGHPPIHCLPQANVLVFANMQAHTIKVIVLAVPAERNGQSGFKVHYADGTSGWLTQAEYEQATAGQ